MIKISIDAMGGDFGPEVVIPGAAKALERHPDIRFIFFGLPAQVEPVLARYPKLKAASEFRASEVAISMDDKPSQALRAGRGKSSMWQAIEAGPLDPFNHSFSIMVECDDQPQLDRLWEALSDAVPDRVALVQGPQRVTWRRPTVIASGAFVREDRPAAFGGA